MKKSLNINKSDFIASGATGLIYRLDTYNGVKRIIKLAKSQDMSAILRNEATIYQIFNNTCKYIPRYYESGMYVNNLTGEEQYGIIIEYIDHKTMIENMKYITSKNINKIFYNIMKILECFHEHNFVVKDVKPDNFLFDPATNRVWMVDLGFVGYSPFKWTEITNFTGTLRYISIRCHDHVNTYYDDIESAIYSVIFCYYGYLPWKIIKLPDWSDKVYQDKVKDIKESGKFSPMVNAFPKIAAIYNKIIKEESLINKPKYKEYYELLN